MDIYKWKIEIILSSGKEITVYYESKKSGSMDAAKEILEVNDDAVISFCNKARTKQVFVRAKEIAYMAVSIEE